MMNSTALRVVWRRAGVLAVAGIACCVACGSAVSRGADFYRQGRYIDAAQVFEHSEDRLARYTDAERARYGLYRGATLRALGYAEGAHHWLDYGSALAAQSLSERERRALFDALLPKDALLPGLPKRRARAAAEVAASHTAAAAAPARLAP